jgi:hypothetical protein
MPGRVLSEVLPTLDRRSRPRALRNYLTAAEQFKTVSMDDHSYGELLNDQPFAASTRSDTIRISGERIELASERS